MQQGSIQPHIHLSADPRFARVLTCGAPERAKLIADRLEKVEKVAGNREYHSYLGKFEGRDILVISHGVGAPGAAICFQELANVGARAIIRLGTAGGLQDEAQIGDAAVATAAVKQDGLSKLMMPLEYPALADLEATRQLIESFRSSGMRFFSGVVVTSDSFYPGLLPTGLEGFRDAGAIAVEMECSALFTIGQLRHIQTGAALVMDGNPLKWKEGNYAPRSDVMKNAMEKSIANCLKALAALEV